jgi:hypothetical protein
METEWITPDGKWRVYAESVNGIIVLSFEELEDNENEYE